MTPQNVQKQKKYISAIKKMISAKASLSFSDGKKLAPVIKRLLKSQLVPGMTVKGAAIQ